jgi:hypothetical protein
MDIPKANTNHLPFKLALFDDPPAFLGMPYLYRWAWLAWIFQLNMGCFWLLFTKGHGDGGCGFIDKAAGHWITSIYRRHMGLSQKIGGTHHFGHSDVISGCQWPADAFGSSLGPWGAWLRIAPRHPAEEWTQDVHRSRVLGASFE